MPAFYGTIFFLAVVVPLFVIGLRGNEESRRSTVMLLLGIVALCLLTLGLPQLLSSFSE